VGTFTREQAKAFYDRLSARQDWQAFYEDPAVEKLIAYGQFNTAQAICEFGCGTGRFAEKLFRNLLPGSTRYVGLDISETMVRLARERLNSWDDRVRIALTDGSPRIAESDASFDRFICIYVLDLLSVQDIRNLLIDARRVLRPGGLLCNVSLTSGQGPLSKAICALWQKIHDWRPVILSGCRPLEVGSLLGSEHWRIKHQSIICRYGICSEVIVAGRRD
jgi:ubiquinone/menaquinone biosynthesis C-methylase UbiE